MVLVILCFTPSSISIGLCDILDIVVFSPFLKLSIIFMIEFLSPLDQPAETRRRTSTRWAHHTIP